MGSFGARGGRAIGKGRRGGGRAHEGTEGLDGARAGEGDGDDHCDIADLDVLDTTV